MTSFVVSFEIQYLNRRIGGIDKIIFCQENIVGRSTYLQSSSDEDTVASIEVSVVPHNSVSVYDGFFLRIESLRIGGICFNRCRLSKKRYGGTVQEIFIFSVDHRFPIQSDKTVSVDIPRCIIRFYESASFSHIEPPLIIIYVHSVSLLRKDFHAVSGTDDEIFRGIKLYGIEIVHSTSVSPCGN